jgi:hypothetical protein
MMNQYKAQASSPVPTDETTGVVKPTEWDTYMRGWITAQEDLAFLLHSLDTEQIDFLLAQVRHLALAHRSYTLSDGYLRPEAGQVYSEEERAELHCEAQRLALVQERADQDLAVAEAALFDARVTLTMWARAWIQVNPHLAEKWSEVACGFWISDARLTRLAWRFHPAPICTPLPDGDADRP